MIQCYAGFSNAVIATYDSSVFRPGRNVTPRSR